MNSLRYFVMALVLLSFLFLRCNVRCPKQHATTLTGSYTAAGYVLAALAGNASPTELQQRTALVDALCAILWQAGGGAPATLVGCASGSGTAGLSYQALVAAATVQVRAFAG